MCFTTSKEDNHVGLHLPFIGHWLRKGPWHARLLIGWVVNIVDALLLQQLVHWAGPSIEMNTSCDPDACEYDTLYVKACTRSEA